MSKKIEPTLIGRALLPPVVGPRGRGLHYSPAPGRCGREIRPRATRRPAPWTWEVRPGCRKIRGAGRKNSRHEEVLPPCPTDFSTTPPGTPALATPPPGITMNAVAFSRGLA